MDFDAQANAYNKRTGFPDAAIAPIVAAICDMAPDFGKAVLMELGAGTGTLGAALAKKAGTYIGMDRSSAMLSQIATCTEPSSEMHRLVGDASTTWPIQSDTVQCFFTSRALHLFDLDNVSSEVQRTADPDGSIFLVGRVERDPESPPSILRREMRRHLLEAGYQAHDGRRAWEQLEAMLCGRGGQRLLPHIAAQWRRYRSPAQMLSAWESKPGLAGLSLSRETKDIILSRVRDWVINSYNDPDESREIRESYVLQGISFKKSAHQE